MLKEEKEEHSCDGKSKVWTALTGEMLQFLHHFCGFSLDFFQNVHVFFCSGES